MRTLPYPLCESPASDAGLFAFPDLDETAQLTGSGAAELFDFRSGSNSVSARVFKVPKASAERQVRTA